jgi:hypothetical protein
MSSGGVFNSVIKSNKSIMLDKTKRFRKILGGFDSSESRQLNFKTATPEQLIEIKKRLQNENKQDRIKQTIWFVIIILIVTSTVVYLMHK